jgi:aryl-alcohol dehydrogenase-like predicted oxidoreductase
MAPPGWGCAPERARRGNRGRAAKPARARTTGSPASGAARLGWVRERHLGRSRLVVSVVGLGCNTFGWRIDESQTRAVVDAAIGVGITLFDTAESYGRGDSEAFLGRAIAGRRDRVVIATKFGWGTGRNDNSVSRGDAAYVRSAIEGSLRRLGTDYVDLYQYHRPDGVTPIEETLGAMDVLVREGKVRWIGHSNFSAVQVEEADAAAAARGFTRFVSAQNEYSWLARDAERDLIPVCERLGLGLLPFFPLARGLLTGKYRRGRPAPDGTRLAAQGLDVDGPTWDRIEALQAFARDRGLHLLDVAIGGLAARPAVASVIAGATTPAQVRANAAAGEWEPSPDELADLLAL